MASPILAPDIVLNRGQLLLSQTTSSLGILSDTSGLLFGVVKIIYPTSENRTVGDIVLFNPDDAIRIIYTNVTYYLIDEIKTFFKEVIAS